MKKKKKNKFWYWIIGVIIVYFVYKELARKGIVPTVIVPNPNLPPFGGYKTPTNAPMDYALHWNNPSGIIKTPNMWTCYGEITEIDNPTNFKAFQNIYYGFGAQLYLLLTYIKNGNNTVKGIVQTWTGLKDTEPYLNTYLSIIGMQPSEKIDTFEKLKQFASNQTYAESNAEPAFYRSIFNDCMGLVKLCSPQLYNLLK